MCDVATSTLDLPSNTLLQLPKPPPTKAWKRAQEEKAKYAKQKGKARIKDTIAEIAAWEAETRKAPKAEGVNSDSNNNGKVIDLKAHPISINHSRLHIITHI